MQTSDIIILGAMTRIYLRVTFVICPNRARLVCSIKGTGALGRVNFIRFEVFIMFLFGDDRCFFCYLVVLQFVKGPSLRVFWCLDYVRGSFFFLLIRFVD